MAPHPSKEAPALGTVGKAALFQKEEKLWDKIVAVLLENYGSHKSTCETIHSSFVGLWLECILVRVSSCMFAINIVLPQNWIRHSFGNFAGGTDSACVFVKEYIEDTIRKAGKKKVKQSIKIILWI